MIHNFRERLSDSPLVGRVWATHSECAGSFISISATNWVIVIAKFEGQISMSLHGPKTRATLLDFPGNAEWFGIDIKQGAFIPDIPPGTILDGNIVLPKASGQSFWLNASAWQFPNYENADTFVNRLERDGLLVRDPVVNAINEEQPQRVSLRTTQYHFSNSTGLSQRTIQQIERARIATALLKQNVSISDAVSEVGFSDQPHLTRSLKRFIGYTPAEIPTASIVGLHQSS